MASALRSTLAGDAEAVERVSMSSCSTEAETKAFIEAAFKEPLEFSGQLSTIPKATLVVGAGKGERSKYEDELPKWVTTALRECNYVEDRAASALPACAGCYKYQHDTGKNEKFVHVFPFVTVVDEDAADEEEELGDVDSTTGAQKAEWMCIISNMETFKEMVEVKVGSWSCKKRLVSLLTEKDTVLETAEQKLQTRTELSAEEQKLFDSADRTVLAEKLQYLRAEMIKMVDEDKLTKTERTQALEQINARLSDLKSNGGPAKALESIQKRAAGLENRLSDKGHRIPLKHEEKMKQLWKKSQSLSKLAEKAGPKGRWNPSLSAAEIKALGEKEEWEAEVSNLANASRFWFEEDDELAARVAGAKGLVAGKSKSKSAPAKASTSVASSRPAASNAGTWSTVSKTSGGRSSSTAAKKPSKPANAFAGLGDSDSD